MKPGQKFFVFCFVTSVAACLGYSIYLRFKE